MNEKVYPAFQSTDSLGSETVESQAQSFWLIGMCLRKNLGEQRFKKATHSDGGRCRSFIHGEVDPGRQAANTVHRHCSVIPGLWPKDSQRQKEGHACFWGTAVWWVGLEGGKEAAASVRRPGRANLCSLTRWRSLAHACQAMLQALGAALSPTFGLCSPGNLQSRSENRHPAKSHPKSDKIPNVGTATEEEYWQGEVTKRGIW